MPFLIDISVLNTNAIPASKLPYLLMVQGEFQSAVILLRYSVCLLLRGPTRHGATAVLTTLRSRFSYGRCPPDNRKWTHGHRGSSQTFVALTEVCAQPLNMPVSITPQRSSQKPLLESLHLGKGVCYAHTGQAFLPLSSFEPHAFCEHSGFPEPDSCSMEGSC